MSIPKPLPNWKNSDVNSLRSFSNIRLIVMDLDGTYVDTIGSKTKEIQKLLRKLEFRGVGITLATGRTLNSVVEIADFLDIDYHLIIYNGSVIVDVETKDAIYKCNIPNKSLSSILAITQDYPVNTYAYEYNGPTKLTNDNFDQLNPIEQVVGWGEVNRPERDPNNLKIHWENSLNTNDMRPNAVVVDGSDNNADLDDLKIELDSVDEITITPSRAPYLEIRPPESDKGSALEYLISQTELSSDNVLAIGDNDNDAEMLSWAEIGISVKGASGKAFCASDYYCETHGVGSAVIEVLRRVISAHRFFNEDSHQQDIL